MKKIRKRILVGIAIVILVCISGMVAATILLGPTYLKEKADTTSEIVAFLRAEGKNPVVSVRGNEVTVKWVSLGSSACGLSDYEYMSKIVVRVKANKIINKVQMYVYNSDGEMIHDYWKGQVEVPRKDNMIPNGPRKTKPAGGE